MTNEGSDSYEFGTFRLNPAGRELLRNGDPVMLPPKAFDTLVVLVKHSGQALRKHDLLHAVWPDTFVDENNLNHYVSLLRKTLGEANGNRYIETVPRWGYRFVADVRHVMNQDSQVMWQRSSRSELRITEEVHEEELSIARFLPQSWKTRTVTIIVAAIVVAGLWVGFSRTSRSGPQTKITPNIKSIAVLPFTPIGSENTDEYLRLGLADMLITRLSRLKQVTVRPTSAVQKYSNSDRDTLGIGSAQKVDAVLDGHIQRTGERIRVTIQLLRVADGNTLWADQFDGQLNDIFTVQDAITGRVARELLPAITETEKENFTRPFTKSPEANEAYLKGQYFFSKRTDDNFRKAAEYFQQAIQMDPAFAQAYVGLADAKSFLDEPETSRELLEKALQMDDSLAEAHASLAFNFHFTREWDWASAEREFKRAIELSPNYATAHHWYAYYLASMKQPEQAIAEIRQAHELDPLSIIINTDIGEILYFARQYDQAIEFYKRSLEMDDKFMVAHYLLGYAYEQKGMYTEASLEFQKAAGLLGEDKRERATGWLGHLYGRTGRRAEALRVVNKLRAELRLPRFENYYLALQLVTIYAALDERDNAFEWLDKTFGERTYSMIYMTMDPRLDGLHSDPRYADLLRRMNLPS